jgi:hypothetical protein
MKINTSGDTIWTRTYNLMGDLMDRQEGFSVKQTLDCGYVVTEYTTSPSLLQQIFLLKVDSLGYSDLKADEDTTTTNHYPIKQSIELEIYPNPVTDFMKI